MDLEKFYATDLLSKLPYGTHRRALYRALLATREDERPVLELGTGDTSTQLLHDCCKLAGKRLYSVDTDPEWRIKFAKLESELHVFATEPPETAVLNTDESPVYTKAGKAYAAHDTVNHKDKEYSRDDEDTGRKATTNAAEGFFGNAKRSLDGTHHHVSGKHLGLYFAEIDYKYNTRKDTDGARTFSGLGRVDGKRLMLRKPKNAEVQ